MLVRLAAFTAIALTLGVAAIPTAHAAADDAAWIKRCVADNADQKQTPTIIAAYCACMNGKMSDNDTLSVTAWEKTHPTEQAACSAEAGWK